MKLLTPLACAILSAGAFQAAAAPAGNFECTGEICDAPAPNEVILRLERGVSIDDINADYGSILIGQVDVGSDPRYLVDTGALSADAYIDAVDNDQRVKDADFNFIVGDPDPGTQSFFFGSIFGDYWNQPSRDILGLNSEVTVTDPGGDPILIAIIDTGIDSGHPALHGRVRSDGVSFIPGDPSTADTGDGVDNDGDGVADELVGHGTFVAGLVHMIAPEAELLPIRIVESDGRCNMFRLAQGIEAAILAGADVINLSLGSNAHVDAVEDAVLAAEALGIPVVCSVGNDGVVTPLRFPAGYTGPIAVAGTDGSGHAAPFTNRGPHVTLCAPAVHIGSTFPGGAYGFADGTSYAAPLVTGVVARMRAAEPTLTPADITLILRQTAIPIDALNPGLEGALGAGRLDAGAALAAVGAAPPLLAGDVTGDRVVDFDDLNTVLDHWATPTPQGDATGDHAVNFTDLEMVLDHFGLGVAGD